MTTFDRIYKLCKDNGLSVTTLEETLGFSNGSIGKLKSKGAHPSADRLQKIAEFFGVSVDYLLTGKDPREDYLNSIYPLSTQTLPVLGKIACGIPKYANEERESYIKSGTDIKADFCLIASGDSMTGARIHDGDIVFIRKQELVENGEIAAVVVNDESEATLKRFFYYQDRALLILRAANPAYEDMIFQGEELNHIHVLGKAVAFQSDII